MKRTAHGLLTGVDYSLEPRRRRRPARGSRALLAVGVLSVLGWAWTMREDASAVAASSPIEVSLPVVASPAAIAAPAPAPRAAATPSAMPVAVAAMGAVVTADAPIDGPRSPRPVTRDEEVQALPAARAVTPAPSPLQAAQTAERTRPESIAKTDTQKLPRGLRLQSSVVLVVDQKSGEVIADKNADVVRPIASLTKLMTALVVTEAGQPLDEVIAITRDDIDREKNSYSRLSVGLKFTREKLLLLALMSSENRAASALGRHYPGGQAAFLAAMNRKARELGMQNTFYADATGLSDRNVSTARDLVRLMKAAYEVPLIREFSTQTELTVKPGRKPMHYVSSNRLVRAKNDWRIGLQKTGFTNAAGRCLVMQATVKSRPLLMVLLDSDGKLTRFADANRVRQWLENGAQTTVRKRSNKSARADAQSEAS